MRCGARCFADKGYLGKELFAWLMDKGIKLVTPLRKNMKNAMMDMGEKLMLRKRALIETVNDQLKNVCQVEHSRHRSPANFLVHLMAGLGRLLLAPHQTRHPLARAKQLNRPDSMK